MRAAALSPFLGAGEATGSGPATRRRAGGRLGRGCHRRAARGAGAGWPARRRRRGERIGAGLQPVEVAAQAVGALAQVDDELRHVALHLLDALAQPVGRRGHVRDVLVRLGLRGVADLLGAALGGLDDRLDLLAGLRGQRRGRGDAWRRISSTSSAIRSRWASTAAGS